MRRAALVAAGVALASACIAGAGAGQQVKEEWQPAEGYLRIGPEPERRIPMSETGYALLTPEGPAVGIVVFVDSRRDPGWAEPDEDSFDRAALGRGLAVLHLTTGDPLDFLFEESDVRLLVDRLEELLESNRLDGVPVHFAGLSLGGTRALRVRIYLETHGAEHRVRPGATAVVDAPLDMERLWRSEGQAVVRNSNPAAADEGRWVRYLLREHLGGSPEQARERYVAYSPYSYSAPGGGNAAHLLKVPVSAYHEPDIDWWIENRRKSYYDMNSLDLAALVAELRASGNPRARLITTRDAREGFESGSTPHTWTIVDNRDLADWFVEMSGGVRGDGE
ncbi:MAG: hypothetical protein Q8W45_04870 [Candidatus Palauibacterales bacterium]|nr:hypothetical protein [Candidatus Palauibacterales bacterium]